jgi:hypothetical protein
VVEETMVRLLLLVQETLQAQLQVKVIMVGHLLVLLMEVVEEVVLVVLVETKQMEVQMEELVELAQLLL